MPYNVGPSHTYSADQQVECGHCHEAVYPVWNGHEGIMECPVCGEELSNEESEA